MKVEKNAKSACVIELSVTADAEEIKADYRNVLNSYVREGVIPGFRKGKAPVALVQQKFRDEIRQDCAQRCFRSFYPKAIEEAGLEVIELEGLTKMDCSPETGMSFTAVVEIKPTFDLPKYKKLAIKKEEPVVSDEDVTKRVESFRAAYAKYNDAAEGAVLADGDFASFDYKGMLKDKPLVELVPDQKAVCEGTDFWVQLEEGRFLPEILEALKGMKAGESKTGVKVKFPKEAAPEPLKGKTCTYDITVKAIRTRTLPDDKTFLEQAKAESLDALRAQFRGQMEKDAQDAEQDKRRGQAIDLLLKKADFDVPPVFVRQQAERALNEFAQRAQYSGLPADYFEKNRDAIMGDATNNAIRQVRLSYILAGIAEAEKFEITDADVKAGLEKIAAESRQPTTADELLKKLTENDQIEGFKDQLKAERALDFVLAEAK